MPAYNTPPLVNSPVGCPKYHYSVVKARGRVVYQHDGKALWGCAGRIVVCTINTRGVVYFACLSGRSCLYPGEESTSQADHGILTEDLQFHFLSFSNRFRPLVVLVVQGDWNAKVDPDAYQHWAGTVGRFGIGETDDRRWRLREFAENHRLNLANTLHTHRLSRTATWHAPNGQVHNQIDFILTPRHFKSCINKANTRSFPGADIGSHHDLVLKPSS